MLIWDCVHSGLCPFGTASIQDCVHLGWCPFGPFGIVFFEIFYWIHLLDINVNIVTTRSAIFHSKKLKKCKEITL